MPASRVRTRQLPGAHPDREHGLDPRRDAGGVDDLLERRQRDHGRPGRPEQPHRLRPRWPARSPATRSPSRWEQLIPAACMNVASPSRSAQSASQVARSRQVSSRGRPRPAVQRGDQRVREVPPARIGPAADQRVPGEPGRRQQPGVVAGQHRHRPRPRAARRPRRRRRTGTPRRCRAHRAGRRGSARRRRPGRPAPPRASAAPRWAGRPPARGTRRSPPGCRASSPAPGAAAHPPDTAAAPPGGR